MLLAELVMLLGMFVMLFGVFVRVFETLFVELSSTTTVVSFVVLLVLPFGTNFFPMVNVPEHT